MKDSPRKHQDSLEYLKPSSWSGTKPFYKNFSSFHKSQIFDNKRLVGWRGELNHRDQAITREKRVESRKSARPEEEVHEDMEARLKADAERLGFESTDALKNLLNNPEAYRKFLEITAGLGFKKFDIEVDNSELQKPKKTQVTSKYSGTVYDTTNWDPLFNPRVRNRIKKDI